MAAVSIPIHGGTVLVDEEDAHLVHDGKWFVHNPSQGGVRYAVSKQRRLHRLIMGAKPNQIVDHINGDGLDNRRGNLRFCTHTQNMQNRKAAYNRFSAYKGVTFSPKRTRPYDVRIKAFGQRIFIGSFATEKAAALAYDRAARVFHGKFARTNASLGLL